MKTTRTTMSRMTAARHKIRVQQKRATVPTIPIVLGIFYALTTVLRVPLARMYLRMRTAVQVRVLLLSVIWRIVVRTADPFRISFRCFFWV